MLFSQGTVVHIIFLFLAGQEDYDRLRPLSYPQTVSITFLCLYNNVRKLWLEKQQNLGRFCKPLAFILLVDYVQMHFITLDQVMTYMQPYPFPDWLFTATVCCYYRSPTCVRKTCLRGYFGYHFQSIEL